MNLILENYQSIDDDVETVEVIKPVPVPEIPVPEIPVPEIQAPEIPVPEPIVIEDVNMTRTSTFT